MDQKQMSDAPLPIGLQGPPAYDQHQQYPQQYPQQFQAQQTYPQSQGQQVVTVITSNAFGPQPTTITCPSCRSAVITRIDYESSTKTHLMAGLICLLFWPCVCLPYMMDSCKNANHYCPHCNAYLGSYRGS